MADHVFAKQAPNALLKGGPHGQAAVLENKGVFVPELWSAQLLQDLEDNLILGDSSFTNRNFEGEFRREGDRIRVPHFIDTVSDKGLVKAYGEIGTPDHASLEYIPMLLAKGSSFAIEIDSIHQMQTRQGIDLMSELVRQRGRQAAISIDRMLAQTLMAATKGRDFNGTETMPMNGQNPNYDALPKLHGTVDTVDMRVAEYELCGVYDFVVAMMENLDLKAAPDSRYLFISPRLRSMILADPKFVDASAFGGASAVMPTGVIGTILGLPVRVSNMLGNVKPKVDDQHKLVKGRAHDVLSSIDMIMGSTSAISLVIPLAEMVAFKPEKTFTDAIKSRVIYDAKVIRPEQVVIAVDVEKKVTEHNKKVVKGAPAGAGG